MALQDKNVVRTAADLEKKYNFAKLLGFNKNIEINNEKLIKVENELNNMLNSLVINLGDLLDSQSSISLWFYEGVPTTSNEPYIDWVTPSDHYGDFYYDQNSGYVYKFTNTGWILQDDENLIQAMAMTNVELDVSQDHERQVYFQQPTPPYESGDWWILEDGTLMICQIGRATGEYQDEDFIVANKYTPTIASAEGDIITIKQGQVIKMSDTFASFTDLATGGSTTIAGENITTGSIKSQNYVQGVSGTKLDLSNGVIDSKNFKLDSTGNLDVEGYITTSKGILTNLQFKGSAFGWNAEGYPEGNQEWFLGFNAYTDWSMVTKNISDYLCAGIYIPEGFTIKEAYIVMKHSPVNWNGTKGYCQHINAFNVTNYMGNGINAEYFSDYDVSPNIVFNNSNVILNAFNGYTFNQNTPEIKKSNDISSVFKSGNNTIPGYYYIAVRTSDGAPVYYEGQDENWYLGRYTGYASMEVNILGYTRI